VLAIGDRRCIGSTAKNLGNMANAEGDHRRAAELLVESLAVRHELGDDAGLAECLEGLAVAAMGVGRPVDAACLLGAAHARRQASGALPHPEEETEVRSTEAQVRAGLAPDEFTRAWEHGGGLGPEEALRHGRDLLAVLGGPVR